jgi:hypothetical protein
MQREMREKEERDALGIGGKATANSEKRREYLQLIDRVTTSFFFTNIPDDATSETLWKLFLKFGRVMEVYIPRKLDKRGRRFGFVKYKEVNDVELLSEKLQEVWLGSFKLLVNRSRFARTDSKEASSGRDNEVGKRSTFQPKDAEVGRSFKTALVGGGAQQKTMVMKVPVNEELCKELQGSMVGTLAREKDVRRIQTTLYMEGFRSITVTNMGGNMVLMRSPVEGDIARLLRSKNECLQYYFSEIKPWNPGMLAVQREVWVQIYGIPIHIWGENFFKMVGKSLGTFLDFDEETARMMRFDVARLKILTSTWSFIDVTIKVEVEGAWFDLWVVEERGRNRSAVVRSDDIEDMGSKVVPSEVEGAVDEDGFSDGVANSGEDENSGDEAERDVLVVGKHGVRLEGNSVQAMRLQVPQSSNKTLTFEKSAYVPNTLKESLSVPPGAVGIEEEVMGQKDKGVDLAVLTRGEDIDRCVVDGSQEAEDRENVELVGSDVAVVGGGPAPNLNSPFGVGLSDPGQVQAQNPHFVDSLLSGQNFTGCEGEIEATRYSSLSEPEEVLSCHRSRYPKPSSKIRKQKPGVKPNGIGVPKFVQLVEALKEAGPKLRRRRQKEGCGVIDMEGVEVDGRKEGVTGEPGSTQMSLSNPLEVADDQAMAIQEGVDCTGTILASGINLISGSDGSVVPNSITQGGIEEKEKLIEAAKLLNIQKEVGFTFEDTDDMTLKQLVDHERVDRVKKMEWERREGDQ